MPYPRRRLVAELVVAALGLAILAGAALATPTWYRHHFLPEFFHSRAHQIEWLDRDRLAAAAVGLLVLLAARPRIGRAFGEKPALAVVGGAAPMLVAIVGAVVAAELVLDSIPWRSTQQAPPMYEPRRVWDDTFGWVQVPNRTGYGVTAHRTVRYAFDVHGYRVRDQHEPVDLARPTIIISGESIIQGHGLAWPETVTAQVEAMTGVQTANIAVGGYATDQLYLLLKSEVPKFRRPVAVVAIFMPGLFHRVMDDDRPHLTRGLVWRPPRRQPRLVEIFRRLVPYRSDRDIADGVAAAQDELNGIRRIAEAQGATPVILVPQFGVESDEERALRRRILDAGHIPYVLAPFPATWRLAPDKHPDARGAAAMARAIVGYLRTQGVVAAPMPDRRVAQPGAAVARRAAG